MKRNTIIGQMFLALLICFIFMLLMQGVFYALWFDKLYSFYMLSDSKRTLSRYADEFECVSGAGSSPILSDYAAKYESPVFVFNENQDVCDNGIFSYMSILSLRKDDNISVRIPVEMSATLPQSVSAALYSIEAVRLGTSRYYDASIIRYDGKTYLYRDVPDEVRQCDACAWIHTEESVRSVSYIEKRGSLTSDRAWSIYDAVKNCLILGLEPQSFLDGICAADVSETSGTVCRFIYVERSIEGVRTFFVSMSPVSTTGAAGRYFNTYFFVIFGIMALLLAILAWNLAKRFVSPLVEIKSVTERIASNDFSVRMKPKKQEELKKLADNINSMADSLERSMGELRHSADTAMRNEARMKKMLADVAHEFKTPLGIISAYTEMIESGNFPDESGHYFRIIEAEIDSLTNMINDVIQLSKMESGNWKHEPRPCEISDLIENALDRFAVQLANEGFGVSCSYEDATVICDGKRIEQVLTNLISNAIKYAGARKRINISVRTDKTKAIVSISNDGHVSDVDIKRIWERYYRGDNSNSVRLPSEGIGLEIVREILIIHGSEYGVRQESDEICFYFSLPIAADGGDAD